MRDIDQCPVCGNTGFVSVMEIKDHFLSKEKFSLMECRECYHRFTSPFPGMEELPAYYQSEEYISHSSSDKGLINRIYKLVRNYTVQQKYNLIADRKRGHKILDIGSGTGELLNKFKENNWEVAGIEPDEGARNRAKSNYYLEIYEEEELRNFPSGYYDVISMWHVLEHVPDLHQRAAEIARLIKEDGLLVIALPNFHSFDAKLYGAYWAAWDVPRHLHHFTKNSLKVLFEPFGFKISEILPMKFDSFYVSMLSEKYKNGKVRYTTAFKNGLKSNLKARNNMNYSSLIYVLAKR